MKTFDYSNQSLRTQYTLERLFEGETNRNAVNKAKNVAESRQDYKKAMELGIALLIHKEMTRLKIEEF